MRIENIIMFCSSCEEIIALKLNEVEFGREDGKTFITVECPECGAFFENEPIETA